MLQPPTPGDADDRIGFIQRWVPPVDIPDLFEDVAAAFMDNNTDENDGSLSALRRLGPQMFTGKEAAAVAGEIVRIETSNLHSESTPPTHTLRAEVLVDDVQFDQAVNLPGIGTRCCPGCPAFITTRPHQNVYGVLDGFEFMKGDSGSPVLDQGGNIVGMANWFLPSIGEPETGGGTNVATIKDVLGYDTWLGTETVPLEGYFDTIDSFFGLPLSAWGWAKDPANPKNSIQVQIYVNGALEATIDANEPRDDVDPNVNYGFRWPIPSQYLTGSNTIQIYAKEHSQSTFTPLLPNSPQSVLANGHLDFCTSSDPCPGGFGDCDSNSECQTGFVCTHNVGANYGFGSGVDVCEGPSLGQAGYCQLFGPCADGEGDCNSNSDCQSGLTCVHNVGATYGWPAGVDVCE